MMVLRLVEHDDLISRTLAEASSDAPPCPPRGHFMHHYPCCAGLHKSQKSSSRSIPWTKVIAFQIHCIPFDPKLSDSRYIHEIDGHNYIACAWNPHISSFSHIYHTSNAVASLHVLECSVDRLKGLPVRDEFIDLQLACHVIVNQVR